MISFFVSKDVNAPVAQLDRASDYGSEGLGFESLRACHFLKLKNNSLRYIVSESSC